MKKYIFFVLIFWAASVAAQKDFTFIPGPDPSAVVKTAPEKPAEFPGGHRAFVAEILKNFRTSPLVKAEIMRAEAVASFMVDTEGDMVDIKIESYEHQLVKNEFLRALKMIKTRWIPAERDGKKVRSLMKQPLVFNLQ